MFFDIAYFLSPAALQKLRVDILLIDNAFFETLPEIRKRQLEDENFFIKIFANSENRTSWEKIYKIKNEYLTNGTEIEGTFEQLKKTMLKEGKIYIDNEENFNPSYLRRAVIFILRDRDLYFLPQSGVYLNVEASINQKNPREDKDYDFLLLSPKTDPKDICQCQVELLWKGLRDSIYLWRKII